MPSQSTIASRSSLARHLGHARRRDYTLIEMMVVLVIVAIIMGMGWSMLKISEGSAVDAGASHLGAQLRLTRQYAVAKREYVALLIPTTANANNSSVTDPAERAKFSNGSIRACIVTPPVSVGSDFTFSSYIDGDAWTYLPSGVEVEDTYDSNMACDNVPLMKASDNVDDVRCVVFRPSGQVYYTSTSQSIKILRQTLGVATSDAANSITITVNWVTGKVKYQ